MDFLNSILKYYIAAKRTAILAQDNLNKKWYHVFSTIELLPTEIPEYNIPTEAWHNNKIIRSSVTSEADSYSYYLSIDDLSIQEALSSFHNPIPYLKIHDEQVNLFNTQFAKEPSGPYPLVLPSNVHKTSDIASVIPKRNSGIYVWTQIDVERKVERFFGSERISKDLRSISELSNTWLGYDIAAQPEHLGNIYLIASNPYFRDFDISLSRNPTGIFYQIKFRRNISEPLKVRIIDKHGDNIALDKIFEIDTSVGLIELPHEPHLTELRIYNSNNDLIAIHEPSVFLKSIQFDMSMKQADFHVKVQDTDGAAKEFVVEKYSAPIPSIIGKENIFNSAHYFKTAQKHRNHIELAKNAEFQFYPGGKTELEKTNLKAKAKKEIISIIDRSNETCFLCDPYFNVSDLIEFAFRIKDSSVKLKIVNSKEFIDKEKAKELWNAISEYNTKPFQKIECRLLRGKSILHDRFIISDMNVWFLGSSFSEFGSRATCIAKVPESTNVQIVKEIERWYYNDEFSQSLEEYINNE